MAKNSDALQNIFDKLGIDCEDPLLKEDQNEQLKEGSSASSKEFNQHEEWADTDSFSLDEDEIDQQFGKTPPRTSRARKQRRSRNEYCFQAVEAAKAMRHKVASRCSSLPVNTNYSIDSTVVNHNITQSVLKSRKRSQDIQRSNDRQAKLRNEDLLEVQFALDEDSDENKEEEERTGSLPPLSTAVRIIQRARYMSVASKKIGDSNLINRKISTSELPPDRVAFYELLSGLVKSSQDQQKLSYKCRSEEETLYQQEINEMIWLELQAWHADQSVDICDRNLLENRKKVIHVYNEIMKFNFDEVLKSYKDKQSTHKIPSFPRYNTTNNTDEPFDFCIKNTTGCLSCLSIWCDECRRIESLALSHILTLLQKVDEITALFPSTSKLVSYFPAWNEPKFVCRYKSLCLWYNITSQLRGTINLLGRRLGHDTDAVPWPTFPQVKSSPDLSISNDSGNHSDDPELKSSVHHQNLAPIVRFELDYEDDSSDPSQSNDSDPSLSFNASRGIESDSLSDHLSPPPPGELKRSSSYVFMEANPYRNYVANLLRNNGMKKTLDKVNEAISDVMFRTFCILNKRNCNLEQSQKTNHGAKLDTSPLNALPEELQIETNWTDEFNSVGLPKFYTLFLFIASIPLHMMRECLRIRIEQMPAKPSKLSITQLMREYKEGVKLSVAVRHKYDKCCTSVLSDLEPDLALKLDTRKCKTIEELDTNIKKMIEVYMDWLDQFILMLHKEPHMAGLQKSFLQDEWRFVQATCPYVTDGESLARTRFCNIACHMLCSVRDFLDTGLDDMLSDLHDSIYEYDSSSSNTDDGIGDVPAIEVEQDAERKKLANRCRALQELLGEARERALRAIDLARMLRKDLEVAVKGSILSTSQQFLNILKQMGHIQIVGHNVDHLLIFVPEEFKNAENEVLPLLQMQVKQSLIPLEKYFIIVNYPSEEFQWNGATLNLGLTAECAIMLARIQINGFMIVATNVCQLHTIKNKIKTVMNGIVSLSSEQMAPLDAVTRSLLDMKNEAVELCKNLEFSISQVENLVNIDNIFEFDEDRKQLAHLIRDSVHQGYLFGFEYHRELMKMVVGKQKEMLTPLLIKFARKWINFVKSHYSQGKGIKPRWAGPGLEFLLFVCDPHHTCYISDEEFRSLRIDVEEAREYIVGSSANSNASTPSTPVLCPKSFRSQGSHLSSASECSPGDLKSRLHFSRTTPVELTLDDSDSIKETRLERVRRKISEFDRKVEDKKYTESTIGRVSSYQRDLIEVKPHNVSFSWQRGFKIGSGRFAKVYTVVNNNTGELLAMKVLPLQPNDHRSIKRVTKEMNTFERICHPNLVKYYGVEILTDEMRIFMEYCEEGTLEALALTTGGLPEEIIRKYTRQLLLGLHCLHSEGIAHRDIKGANIFLAEEGNVLKLGDFGCAAHIRGAHTEVGELKGIVGTHAYMAPEIISSNEGHGRAADIWSVGCVVIEMATGQRPWPDYDSSVQIMFQVGQGKSPPVPEKISEEGEDFLLMCFQHDPKKRALATKLLDHTFVKVGDDEMISIQPFSYLTANSSFLR